MASFLYNLGTIAIYVFILASMFLTGLMVTVGDLVAPLHNRRLLFLSLFANFLLVPLIAVALIILIPMNPELAAGLLLVSIAAGAPSTAKVAQFTGGNVARAVSLTIILTIITVILTPFLVPFILEGAQANPLSVMANLVVMILIPLVLGIIIKSRSEPLAARIRPVMDWASNISIAVIFLTFGVIFLSRLREIVSSSSGAIAVFVAIVFTLAALGITYLIGGFEPTPGRTLPSGPAFGTALPPLWWSLRASPTWQTMSSSWCSWSPSLPSLSSPFSSASSSRSGWMPKRMRRDRVPEFRKEYQTLLI